jgi:hypothetical protein
MNNADGFRFAGLVKIAENSDYPIALLNIIKNGEYGIAATYNEIGSVTLTFRPVRNIEIFGGPSINYMQSDNLKNKDMFSNHSIWKKYSDTQLKQVYIGYQVGIQVLF